MEQLVMKARGKIKQLVLLLVYMLLVGTEAEITSAYSWGGAEITTVDQHTYSFNGHGEYTFLETSNQSLQIQARTDFMIEGNTDATIFVAFVLSVNLKNDTITIVYNRTDRLLYLYQHDGSLWTNSNGSKHPEPSTNRGFILVCTPPYGFIVMPTQRISIRKLTFSGHNFMGITVDTYGRDVVDLKGLAGNLVQGYFIAGNGSKVKSNSTERQMFEFGETWTVSESESKFNYSITGGNYTFWNGRHDVPKFLQDIAEKGDLLRLFEGFSDANITLFNETCRNSWDMQPNIQCLVVIGTTEDVTLGQAVMKAAEERHYKYLLQHNKPPHFKNNTPTFLNVTLGTNLKILDVKLYVTDDFDDPDEMTYNVITQVKNYTFNNGSFTWNVGTYLRYSDSSLTFTVNDTLGYLAARQIIIYYCGCENPSQCDFRSFNNNSSATIQKAACKCPAYSGGLYCEVQLDPCKDYTCYENNCNGYFNRNSPAWPCADCPEGKTNLIASYKQTCENINECTVGPNPCGQICNDTDGSYKCFCKEGFTLNIDGHKCDDIDECTLTPSKCTGENEVCLNIEGNFSCICKPGYSKKSDACEQEGGYTYVGHMSFTILVNAEHVSVINKTIDTYQNRKDIQDKIAAGFNNTKGFLGVEVFRLTLLIHQGNKTRPQAGRYDVRADYVVHWRNVTDIKDIDSENVLCNLTSNGNCDPATTACQQQNGTTVCNCKDGYGKLNPSDKFCIDIDECAENKTDCSGHGNCRNMLGDYTCDCDKGFIFNETNKSCEDFDECYYNYTVCGNREICINTVGAFKCICAPGYFRASKNEPCKIPGKLEDSVNVKCNSSQWDISMDIDMLKTIYPGIRPHNIYLGESQCHGILEGSILMFNYNISSCKTTKMTSGITHIFSNKLFYVIFDPVIPYLIRRHIWTFAVECDVIRGGTGTSHLHHGIETHHATYVQHYNVTVELFSDQNFQHPIHGGTGIIHVGEDVYVKISTTIPDWNTKMRLHTCFTRPNTNSTSDLDVVLINNGCEVDGNTHIISQSTHETRFVFQDFEYLTNDEGLDIYCNATFCDSKDYSSCCVQTCHQRPSLIG